MGPKSYTKVLYAHRRTVHDNCAMYVNHIATFPLYPSTEISRKFNGSPATTCWSPRTRVRKDYIYIALNTLLQIALLKLFIQ
jgi:hypothetical protein